MRAREVAIEGDGAVICRKRRGVDQGLGAPHVRLAVVGIDAQRCLE
jgi:hypothetical protein